MSIGFQGRLEDDEEWDSYWDAWGNIPKNKKNVNLKNNELDKGGIKMDTIEMLIDAKNTYINMVRTENRLVLINKKIGRIRTVSFVWVNNTISPKTDRFLFLADEQIGSIDYIVFKHLRNKPILKWDKCSLPDADVQRRFCKRIGETPPYRINFLVRMG